MLRILCIVLLMPALVQAQVIGGESVFQFLRLAPTPRIDALGSMSIVHSSTNDLSLAAQNPAMLTPNLHNQKSLNFNSFLAQSKFSNLNFAHYYNKLQTVFSANLQYNNYGTFQRTDVLGNNNGSFTANSFALTISAARKYLSKWRYGANLKFAASRLDQYTASGLMADVGVVYADTSNGWYFGALAKNFGIQTKQYIKGNTETLPFDIQLAAHHKFKKSPLRIGALIHHLYQWDIRYDNPEDYALDIFGNPISNTKNSWADKILRHFVFSADIVLSKRLEISAGYNHLRRQELNISSKQALSGFSIGAGLNLGKFQLRYARAIHNVAANTNFIGLNVNMYSAFGLGKKMDLPQW